MPVASLVLLAAASVGIVALAVQLVHVLRHRRAPALPRSSSEARPGISILKPLCGVDDDLEANLEQFASHALLFVAWCNGLFSRTVDWRGNRLRVLPGTRLAPAEAKAPLALSPSEASPAEELLVG